VQAVGDGSLWGSAGDSVLRIDPDSGSVQATIPIARAQTVAFDGSTVWVLVSPRSSDPVLFEPIAGTASVVRIDPATDRVLGEPVTLEDLQPIAMAADDQGAWVADYYDGILSRVEVAG
jgi:DNA-binding beta-propeller fold protein YncE